MVGAVNKIKTLKAATKDERLGCLTLAGLRSGFLPHQHPEISAGYGESDTVRTLFSLLNFDSRRKQV